MATVTGFPIVVRLSTPILLALSIESTNQISDRSPFRLSSFHTLHLSFVARLAGFIMHTAIC